MNEELKNKLNEVSVELLTQLQNGAQYTSEQVPIFLREFILSYIIKFTIDFLIWTCISGLFLYFSRRFKKAGEKNRYDSEAYNFGKYACLGFAVVAFLINAGYNITNLAQVIWTPRVILMQELQHILGH
jgi:hypothetical protein